MLPGVPQPSPSPLSFLTDSKTNLLTWVWGPPKILFSLGLESTKNHLEIGVLFLGKRLSSFLSWVSHYADFQGKNKIFLMESYHLFVKSCWSLNIFYGEWRNPESAGTQFWIPREYNWQSCLVGIVGGDGIHELPCTTWGLRNPRKHQQSAPHCPPPHCQPFPPSPSLPGREAS